MYRPDIAQFIKAKTIQIGLAHFAESMGSRKMAGQITEKLNYNGVHIVGLPRTSGDGYYESVISDPEANLREITI